MDLAPHPWNICQLSRASLAKAQAQFEKLLEQNDNPMHLSRDPDSPIGLKVCTAMLPLLDQTWLDTTTIQNLGATCYANSSLQVGRLKTLSQSSLSTYYLRCGSVTWCLEMASTDVRSQMDVKKSSKLMQSFTHGLAKLTCSRPGFTHI
jgi:hypothetical protein